MKKQRKVLVVVDMQNDFITGSLKSESAEKIVPNVVKKIEEYKGRSVFLTRDTHFINYDETLEGKNLPILHCVLGTEGRNINKDVWMAVKKHREDGYVEIIDKYTFGSTYLADILGAMLNDNDEIEIIGLCTNICVIANAMLLRAKLPNTKIVVDASCCAGTSLKEHTEALDMMRCCNIEVIKERKPKFKKNRKQNTKKVQKAQEVSKNAESK